MNTKTIRKIMPLLAACVTLAGITSVAQAQATKVVIGLSGWTGFAPLTLADKAGIFKQNGVDVEIKMIPHKDRHLALAAGAIQCAATTIETHVAWNANGVPIKQMFQLDKSYGADGVVARNDIKTIADLKGKTIAVDAPGTTSYFMLAWVLNKNDMSVKDVKTAMLSPQAAAQSFVAGQNDAAMTYEPYLSTVRNNPDAGHILASTLDYPMVMDTFGCDPKWLAANEKAGQALADSYFQALDMIEKEPLKSYTTMGAAVKQTPEQFEKSASFLRWQDKEANQKFFAGGLLEFMQESTKILLETGVIRKAPEDLSALFDTRFIQ
jgi:NitT/TauT family transport system substrate-binding protein